MKNKDFLTNFKYISKYIFKQRVLKKPGQNGWYFILSYIQWDQNCKSNPETFLVSYTIL